MTVESGPDFICIGMQKAGTGWLFDQLQFHPDFWIPPIKELHYLDRPYTNAGNAEKFLEIASRKRRRKRRLAGRRPWDERDIEFLKTIRSYGGLSMELEKYSALFRFKGEKLSGDITPGYSGLAAEAISAIGRRFPDLRVMMILRDPVSRLWSQLSMAHRRERFDRTLLADVSAFRRYVESSEAVQKVAYASRIAERWRKNAPSLRFAHFFFEDIAERPEEARNQIVSYLGGNPSKASGEIAVSHNRKSSAEKLELTPEIEAAIVDHFAGELRVCADMFGGHAANWPGQYGLH